MLKKLFPFFQPSTEQPDVVRPEEETALTAEGQLRIVVLEYFSEVRQRYARALEGFGYFITGSVDEALAEAKDCAVVILDDRQPDICGFRIASQLKQEKPDLPVLIVTANCSLEAHEEFKASGASAILFKPAHDLVAYVNRLLVKSSAEPIPPRPQPKKRGRRPFSFLDIAEKHASELSESGLSKAEFARKHKLSLSLLKNELRIAALPDAAKKSIRDNPDCFRKSFFEHICKLDAPVITDLCTEIAQRGKQGACYDLAALKQRVTVYQGGRDEISADNTG